MYLTIHNQGEIENGALSLLGASTKEGDQIGKFGSGFKYALAVLLRNGIRTRIFSGEREIPLEVKMELFRDKAFGVIWIDGQRTSLTTSTGPDWKARDAVREIWSNALDEGEAMRGVSEEIIPAFNTTTVAIEIDDEIQVMIDNWSMYFVHDEVPVWRGWGGRIIKQQVSNYYRRGVWICEDRDRTGIFSYDFNEIELPESRKIKTAATMYWVSYLLSQCDDLEVFDTILRTRVPERMEWQAMHMYHPDFGSTGTKTLQKAFRREWEFVGDEKNRDQISKLATGKKVYWATGIIHAVLSRILPRIENEVDFNDTFSIIPWPIGYRDRLTPVLTKLKKVGVDLTQFDLKFVELKEPTGAIALADMKSKSCLLTAQAFESAPELLTMALVEEWTHLEHGAVDCTVGQQHVYLKLIANLINKL
jgi:hypothetical protein